MKIALVARIALIACAAMSFSCNGGSETEVGTGSGGTSSYGGGAGASGSAGREGGDGSADAAALKCTSQCACPAGTLCTIDGTCVGTACTQPCAADGGCPCGKSCVGNFCAPLVGSLQPCKHDCDCPSNEWCAAGKCVHSCGRQSACLGADGKDNGMCGACGEICNTESERCVKQGSCACNEDCATQGLDGACVNGQCQAPTGSVYAAAISSPVPIEYTPGPGVPAGPSIPIEVSATTSITSVAIQIDFTGFAESNIVYATLTAPDKTSSGMMDILPMCLDQGNARVVAPSQSGEFDGALAGFTGYSATGTWTFTIDQAPAASIAALKLFIR